MILPAGYTKPIRVVAIVQTCGGCPSQWSGLTDRGDFVYVRYRWGYLSIRIHDIDPIAGPEVWGQQLGDNLAGVIDYDQLVEATREEIQWPEQERVKR